MQKSVESDSVREVIERLNAKAVRSYAAGDVDSLCLIFSEDCWQMPPNSPPLIGRTAIREFWTEAVKWGKWDFRLETRAVDVSGTMAVERGKYVVRFTAGPNPPPAMPSFEDRGNYLVHWRQETDGEWRIVADAPVSELRLKSARRE